MTDSKRPLSYRDAGVDIDAGNALVKRISPIAKRTRRPLRKDTSCPSSSRGANAD